MNSIYIKSALLNRRNIAAFAISYAGLLFLSGIRRGALDIWPELCLAGAFAVYAGFSAQCFFSGKFRRECDMRHMLDGIKRVIQNCQIKARYLKRSLDETGQKRLGKVIQDVGEMARSFMAGDKSPLKIQIMQKTLKLTEMYVKLIDDFSKRLRTSVSSEISNIANRINTNTSNLNNARDAGVAAEIRRVIESDERMIESLKGERKELEKLDARLQFMESTIGMLKYNLIYNLDSEDMLKKLETEIDEATAINFALSDLHEERRGKARSW